MKLCTIIKELPRRAFGMPGRPHSLVKIYFDFSIIYKITEFKVAGQHRRAEENVVISFLDCNNLVRLPAKKRECFHFILFHFISKFIFLTCRKASETLYIEQAITPTCFRRCQDIAVRLKFFYFLFFSFY